MTLTKEQRIRFSKLNKFKCLRGDSAIPCLGRFVHFLAIILMFFHFIAVNEHASPEGYPFFDIWLRLGRNREEENKVAEAKLAEGATDWTMEHLLVLKNYDTSLPVPMGVIVQILGYIRIVASCFTGHEVYGIRVLSFPQVLRHSIRKMFFHLLVNFPYQVFGLLDTRAMVYIETCAYMLYIFVWERDVYISATRIGITAYVIFFTTMQLFITILLTNLWMCLPSVNCYTGEQIDKFPTYMDMYCPDPKCELLNIKFSANEEGACTKESWKRNFGVGLLRFPVAIPPPEGARSQSNYQLPYPGPVMKYVFITGSNTLMWRKGLFYMNYQVGSLGLGSTFPTNSDSTFIVTLGILVGMVWNLWLFYALMGGWWQDRTSFAYQYSDQLSIVETFIQVAKQTENAEKLKRFAYLSYHRKNSLLALQSFNLDITSNYRDEMMFKLNIKALASMRLFENADPVFLNAIAYCLEPTMFVKGELIVGSDNKINGLYYIRKGEAYVIIYNGFVGHMGHLFEGDYFGEYDLYNKGLSGPIHAKSILIIASTDCDFLLLRPENYIKCCQFFPKKIVSQMIENYRRIARGETFKKCKPIKTFQPDDFYTLSVQYSKTKDPQVWLEGIAKSKVVAEQKMRLDWFSMFTAIVGLLSPFIFVARMIPSSWADVVWPSNIISSSLYISTGHVGRKVVSYTVIILTQFIMVIAFIDLIVWVRMPIMTDFGLQKVPIRYKCIRPMFYLRASKIVFIAVMWHNVMEIVDRYRSPALHLALFILTMLIITTVVSFYFSRALCYYNFEYVNITSPCHYVNEYYSLINDESSKLLQVCKSFLDRFNLDPNGLYCHIGILTRMRILPIKLIDFNYESQLHHDFDYILELQRQCKKELDIQRTKDVNITGSREIETKRSFEFVYYLMALGLGVGEDSIIHPAYLWAYQVVGLMLAGYYLVIIGQISGYLSAYYSIKTGNKVRIASWLTDLNEAMLERKIDNEDCDLVLKNIIHFIEDFNRISCHDEAYLLQTIPTRLFMFNLPEKWQLMTNFLRNPVCLSKMRRSLRWFYFTPGTRIANLGDISNDFMLLAKGIIIQIDGDNVSCKSGPGTIIGLLSCWTKEREVTVIALTYVQIATISWPEWNESLKEFPIDNYVWKYVVGTLAPLVEGMRLRIQKPRSVQIRHEISVNQFLKKFLMKQKIMDRRVFVLLKMRFTSSWNAISKVIFMSGHFVRIGYFEEFWAYVKLINSLALIWIIPVMFVLNISYLRFEVPLGFLTLLALIDTYMEWHTPIWQPETGIMVSTPPQIFEHWFKFWSLSTFLMKFPLEIFFLWADIRVVNGMRLVRLWHFFELMGKFGRIKSQGTFNFGRVMQVTSTIYTVLFLHITACFWILLVCKAKTNEDDDTSCTRCSFFEWRFAFFDSKSDMLNEDLLDKFTSVICIQENYPDYFKSELEKKKPGLERLKFQLEFEYPHRDLLLMVCEENVTHNLELGFVQIDLRPNAFGKCHARDHYCELRFSSWFEGDFFAGTPATMFDQGIPFLELETECLSWSTYYLMAVYWSVVFCYGVGFGDVAPYDWKDCVGQLFVLLLSSIMKSLILAQFASPIIDEDIVNYDLYCRFRNEIRYMRNYKVEKDTAKKVEHSEEMQTASKCNILYEQKTKLPAVLFQDIMYKSCEKLFKQMGIYEQFSLGQLKLLASNLREKIVPQGELVIRDGDIMASFMIVKEGRVTLTGRGKKAKKEKTLSEDKEMMSNRSKRSLTRESKSVPISVDVVMGVGTCVGCPEERVGSDLEAFIHVWSGSLKAVDHCVVLVLPFESIMDVMSHYPDKFEPVILMLKEKCAETIDIIATKTNYEQSFNSASLIKERRMLCRMKIIYPNENPLNIFLIFSVFLKSIVYPFYINETIIHFSIEYTSLTGALVFLLVVCNVITIIEMLLRVHMAYFDQKEKRIVVDAQQIWSHYRRKRFPADVVAALPLWILHFVLEDQMTHMDKTGLLWLRLLLDCVLLSLPIWTDLFQMRHFFGNPRQEQPSSTILKLVKRILSYFVAFFCITGLLAGIWAAIGCVDSGFVFENCRPKSWVYIAHVNMNVHTRLHMYLTAFYFVINLCGNGRGDITSHNTLEMVYAVFAIVIMNILVVFIQANVGAMVYRRTMPYRLFKFGREDSKQVLESYKARPEICDRTLDYLKMSMNYFEHHRIHTLFTSLTMTIKRDVVHQLCQNFFDQLPALKPLSIGTLRLLSLSVREQLYLPGDTVVDRGEIIDRAYYITKGEVFVIDPKKKKAKILQAKSVFGPDCVVLPKKSNVTYKAKTMLAVYYLEEAHVQRLVSAMANAELLTMQRLSYLQPILEFHVPEKEDKEEEEVAEMEDTDQINLLVDTYWMRTKMQMARSRRQKFASWGPNQGEALNEENAVGFDLGYKDAAKRRKPDDTEKRTNADWQLKYDFPTSALAKKAEENRTDEVSFNFIPSFATDKTSVRATKASVPSLVVRSNAIESISETMDAKRNFSAAVDANETVSSRNEAMEVSKIDETEDRIEEDVEEEREERRTLADWLMRYEGPVASAHLRKRRTGADWLKKYEITSTIDKKPFKFCPDEEIKSHTKQSRASNVTSFSPPPSSKFVANSTESLTQLLQAERSSIDESINATNQVDLFFDAKEVMTRPVENKQRRKRSETSTPILDANKSKVDSNRNAVEKYYNIMFEERRNPADWLNKYGNSIRASLENKPSPLLPELRVDNELADFPFLALSPVNTELSSSLPERRVSVINVDRNDATNVSEKTGVKSMKRSLQSDRSAIVRPIIKKNKEKHIRAEIRKSPEEASNEPVLSPTPSYTPFSSEPETPRQSKTSVTGRRHAHSDDAAAGDERRTMADWIKLYERPTVGELRPNASSLSARSTYTPRFVTDRTISYTSIESRSSESRLRIDRKNPAAAVERTLVESIESPVVCSRKVAPRDAVDSPTMASVGRKGVGKKGVGMEKGKGKRKRLPNVVGKIRKKTKKKSGNTKQENIEKDVAERAVDSARDGDREGDVEDLRRFSAFWFNRFNSYFKREDPDDGAGFRYDWRGNRRVVDRSDADLSVNNFRF